MEKQNIKHLKESLNKFAKTVISKSKKNLRPDSSLAKSLQYYVTNAKGQKIKDEIKVGPNSIELDFAMNYYGPFYDKGVKGADPNALPEGSKQYGKQRGKNSPYKFGKKNNSRGTLRASINGWLTRKNLKDVRDKSGRFTSRKTAIFLISRSIWYSGLKPSLFFTKPFEQEYKKLPKQLEENFALDVERMLAFTTKNINKDER